MDNKAICRVVDDVLSTTAEDAVFIRLRDQEIAKFWNKISEAKGKIKAWENMIDRLLAS